MANPEKASPRPFLSYRIMDDGRSEVSFDPRAFHPEALTKIINNQLDSVAQTKTPVEIIAVKGNFNNTYPLTTDLTDSLTTEGFMAKASEICSLLRKFSMEKLILRKTDPLISIPSQPQS